MASAPAPPERDHAPSVLDPIVDRLNGAIESVPMATIASLIMLDLGTVFATNAALYATGVAPTAEFALAYALSRVVKRFRLPLEIAAAAPLAKAVPALARVRVVNLLVPGYKRPEVMPTLKMSMDAVRRPMETLRTLGEMGAAVVDRYGLAYNLASRGVGVVVIVGLHSALVAGLDVQGWLEGAGMGGAGTAAGTFGLAVTLASAAYPFTLVAAAYGAPQLARLVPLLARKP